MAEKFSRDTDCRPVDKLEILSLIGLLRGKHLNIKDLWTDGFGAKRFRMPMNRFTLLLSSLRLNNNNNFIQAITHRCVYIRQKLLDTKIDS